MKNQKRTTKRTLIGYVNFWKAIGNNPLSPCKQLGNIIYKTAEKARQVPSNDYWKKIYIASIWKEKS